MSDGLVHEFLARRLSTAQPRAVLIHELGHLATRATRFDLAVAWLTAPARTVTRIAARLGSTRLSRHQPRRFLAASTCAAVVIAIMQSGEHGQPAATGMRAAVASLIVLGPVIAAAVSRCGEYAADRFAACHGAGPDLIAALVQLDVGPVGQRHGAARILAGHPTIERRAASIERHTRAGRR